MQSEQTRQSKREQRRRKREEKRQALRSGGTTLGGIPVPQTAISEVLLEYVSPLFERLSLAARPEQLRTLLQLAVIVWNAMLDTSAAPEDKARRMIARMQSKFWTPPPAAVVDWLAWRRILRYGDDPRLIASADVVRESDEIRVIATAEPPGAWRSASRPETSAGRASNPSRTGDVGGGC
jgi:hypothetical protein